MSDLFKLTMGSGLAFGFMSSFIAYFIGYGIRYVYDLFLLGTETS